MHWHVHYTVKAMDKPSRIKEIIKALYRNRGLTDANSINSFLNPPHPVQLSAADAGINPKSLNKAVILIKKAIETKQPILIYGDYDADGITATAIVWEQLHALGALVVPFIPNRERHGYGLSPAGFDEALAKTRSTLSISPELKPLIITVDNGITAIDSVAGMKAQGFTVIVTDHHTPQDKLPAADCVIHTTSLCGAGVAWMLIKELSTPENAVQSLDLACIGTVADMMPVVGINRSFIYHGLSLVQHTSRPGLQALLQQAGVDTAKPLTTSTIGYAIAPRLNAMGRLHDALDSLRLLCTRIPAKARELAATLGDTNRTRQDLTMNLLEHAKAAIKDPVSKRILIIDHDSYHEGIVGLIAGKLVETYYRPAIVISRKEGISKASARSIPGVNITDLIRSQSHLLAGVGGHPMAAGFSIDTGKIPAFIKALTTHAENVIDSALLEPSINIDCQIDIEDINQELYQAIEQLQPFGIGNTQPLFTLDSAAILSKQNMGNTNQHLKLLLKRNQDLPLPALWFGHGDKAAQLNNSIDRLAFNLDQNTWKGKTTLQLLIKAVQ